MEIMIRDKDGNEHIAQVDLDSLQIQADDISGHDLALLVGMREAFLATVDVLERRLKIKTRTSQLRKDQRRKS